MNIPLEIKVIQKFFRKEKQERYIGFITSGKNRRKFIKELPHLKDLNWEMFIEINSFNEAFISPVNKGKNQVGKSCYVISEDPSFDQTTIDINQVNRITGTGYAMIIVFGEADRVYYEGEPPYNRYLSITSPAI